MDLFHHYLFDFPTKDLGLFFFFLSLQIFITCPVTGISGIYIYV